jgi:hypothetical protein
VLDGGDGVVAWERLDAGSGDRRVVLVSMADGDEAVTGLGDLIVDVSSDGTGEGASFSGSLGPGQALWLRPPS